MALKKSKKKEAPAVKKKVEAKAGKPVPKKEKKPRGPSYQTKIIECMNTNKGVASREQLMAATGADARNLSVAVSILKNGKRTKQPLDIRYVRSTGTFYALPMAAAALKAAEKIAAAAALKKPKKTKKSEPVEA
jgi:hypothetical protein